MNAQRAAERPEQRESEDADKESTLCDSNVAAILETAHPDDDVYEPAERGSLEGIYIGVSLGALIWVAIAVIGFFLLGR